MTGICRTWILGFGFISKSLYETLTGLDHEPLRGICIVINHTWCSYINNSGLVELLVQKTYQQATGLIISITPLLKLSGFHQRISAKCDTVSTFPRTFNSYHIMATLWSLFNLLAKCVSSRLQQFHVKTMVMLGFQPIPAWIQPDDPPLGLLDRQPEISMSSLCRVNAPDQQEVDSED